MKSYLGKSSKLGIKENLPPYLKDYDPSTSVYLSPQDVARNKIGKIVRGIAGYKYMPKPLGDKIPETSLIYRAAKKTEEFGGEVKKHKKGIVLGTAIAAGVGATVGYLSYQDTLNNLRNLALNTWFHSEDLFKGTTQTNTLYGAMQNVKDIPSAVINVVKGNPGHTTEVLKEAIKENGKYIVGNNLPYNLPAWKNMVVNQNLAPLQQQAASDGLVKGLASGLITEVGIVFAPIIYKIRKKRK
jgi:hypothetical protein